MEGTPAQRKYLCEQEFLYFAIYYFPQFFTYRIPPFHYEMYQDLKDLLEHRITELAWVMFRESAKTSITKMFICYLICYRKKRYINWDSYDKGNAEAALFDVAVQLQTNKRLISDFGQLYYDPKTEDKKSSIKRIGNFITTNNVRVEAFSTQESTRGRVYNEFRPDQYVLDDFETFKTKESLAITQKIEAHIDELKSGLSVDANVIYLCNLITESGNVAKLIERSKTDPMLRVRRVDVEMDGQVTWPDKYVQTDEEAAAANKTIEDPKRYKVSLEAKKRTLGERVYAVEMLNSPEAAGDLIYDRTKIDSAIRNAKPPLKSFTDLKMWDDYNPSHRYGGGADTAKGVGRDSNAYVIIDYSTNPARVVATYKNNRIAPDKFAYELKRGGELFGICLLAPEINNTGYATITQLKQIYPLERIYKQIVKDTATQADRRTVDLGWETTTANKPEIAYQFKSAFEDGLLQIDDVDLLTEMRHFGQMELNATDSELEQMTRHFDLLTAAWIAWEMRHYAKLSTSTGVHQFNPNAKTNKPKTFEDYKREALRQPQ